MDEPEIYANRLLGIKVNTTERIVLRKQNGVVTKNVRQLVQPTPSLSATNRNSNSADNRKLSAAKIKKFNETGGPRTSKGKSKNIDL